MNDTRRFRDRVDAGRQLAERLDRYRAQPDIIVLGLPRGGVPVAAEVARALGAPLDVMLVRKLGLPQQPELAMGAIASGGIRVMNEDLLSYLRIPQSTIDAVAAREQQVLDARERAYRGDRPPVTLDGKTVILVDDGLATGASMRAAVSAARQRKAARVVVAVPVAAPETISDMRREVDDIVFVQAPSRFSAVGLWYEDFSETSDETVTKLLR